MKRRTRLLILAALGSVIVATAGAQVFPVRLDPQEAAARATTPSVVLNDGYIEFMDGSVQVTAGRADPPCYDNKYRFVNCGNGTVTDTKTGLIWLEDLTCAPVSQDWKTANETVSDFSASNCRALTDGSRPGDWRLPTWEEWQELGAPSCPGTLPPSPRLVGNGSPKVDCFGKYPWATGVGASVVYWSSSAGLDGDDAIVMNMSTGQITVPSKHDSADVWAVRSGGWPDQRTAQPASPVPISLALPDGGLEYPDGSVQLTASRMDPPCYDGTHRFADCGNGTVTDSRTGLVWLADLTCFSTIRTYPDANQIASQLSERKCAGLADGSRPGDWRLPTEEEWRDIVAPSCPGDPEIVGNGSPTPGCFSDHPWATGVGQTAVYWSSATTVADKASAVVMDSGGIGQINKHDSTLFWPVRRHRGQVYP